MSPAYTKAPSGPVIIAVYSSRCVTRDNATRAPAMGWLVFESTSMPLIWKWSEGGGGKPFCWAHKLPAASTTERKLLTPIHKSMGLVSRVNDVHGHAAVFLGAEGYSDGLRVILGHNFRVGDIDAVEGIECKDLVCSRWHAHKAIFARRTGKGIRRGG